MTCLDVYHINTAAYNSPPSDPSRTKLVIMFYSLDVQESRKQVPYYVVAPESRNNL